MQDTAVADPSPTSGANRLNASAGAASVTVALVLVALKLWALWMTGSLSVAASLADSALDLLMSFAALAAILYAARPPDEDHTFGHTSVEDLTALAQAIVIVAAATLLIWTAAGRLLSASPAPLAAEGLGLAVMAASAAITLGLVLWQGHVAGRTGSRVVAADRLHYLGDLLPTLGAMMALAASALFGIGALDSIVALVAAAVMLRGATRIGSEAWDALMDRRADPAIEARIAAMARDWPGVHGHHDLRTRRAGSRVFVSLHLELDGDQTLAEAHAIGAGLRRAIIEVFPQADVIIHKDIAGRGPTYQCGGR